MERPLSRASAGLVRSTIARALLAAPAQAGSLGTVVLRPHQLEAVARLRAALDALGGALLADATGLGKTYVALAIARDFARPLVVAPAGLREMWREAMRATGTDAATISLERLGRASPPAVHADLVVVDEAHHARNPATRRHRALAALCAGARVLLLSATPVHNRPRDLAALLSLFLGERAAGLGSAELAACVVRRTAAPDDRMPRVAPAVPIDPGGGDAQLASLLALPPPVPAADAGVAGALVVLGLVRQWASSEGALRAALRRRAVAGTALLAALEGGEHPTRAELRRWIAGDDAIQLALPGLVAAARPVKELRAAIEAHLAGVRAALGELDASAGADRRRADALVALRARHAGERIVAFSQFADTVRALFRELRAEPRVAALTATGAQIAGGRLSRAEAVRRFAPRANGGAEPGAADRIDLLLTTDLLSEGVNLQDASVVVHLDLPWTPARLEQRVGRVARLGAAHDRVAVYVMRPPAAARARLGMERRLRAKLDAASRVAVAPPWLLPATLEGPDTLRAGDAASVTTATEEIRETLRRWLSDAAAPPAAGGGPVGVVCRARRDGWIALLGAASGARLLASVGGGRATEEPRVVARALALAAEASELAVSLPDAARALDDAERAVEEALARIDAAGALGLEPVAASPARRDALRRIAAACGRASLGGRRALAPLAARARRAVLSRLGLGAERQLAALVAVPLADDEWLAAVAALGGGGGAEASEALELRALLVLVAEPAPAGEDHPAGGPISDVGAS